MINCTCYPKVVDGFVFNTFIAYYFSECVYTPKEVLSFYIGMSSILFWICCQVPQFLKNYRRKSGSALSKWFLIEWFMGDALNIVGCILTHQLITQFATGVLFVVVDIMMISQMAYYSCYYKRKVLNDDESTSDSGEDEFAPLIPSKESNEMNKSKGSNSRPSSILSPPKKRISIIEVPISYDDSEQSFSLPNDVASSSPLLEEIFEVKSFDDNRLSHSLERQPLSQHVKEYTKFGFGVAVVALPLVCVSFLSVGSSSDQSENYLDKRFGNFIGDDIIWGKDGHINPEPADKLPSCEPHFVVSPLRQHAGLLVGWISAAVYLNSRVPQVIKNYKRKSVEGLSLVMFSCAVLGNTTYGLGVLLKDSSWVSIRRSLPWLVGSLGTLFLDFFIITQFIFYRESRQKDSLLNDYYESTPDFNARIQRIQSKKPNDYVQLGDGENVLNRPHHHHVHRKRMLETPSRGLFGLKAWTNSPFVNTRPSLKEKTSLKAAGVRMKPDTDEKSEVDVNGNVILKCYNDNISRNRQLRDNQTLGILPSEASGFISLNQSNVGKVNAANVSSHQQILKPANDDDLQDSSDSSEDSSVKGELIKAKDDAFRRSV